MTLTIPSSRFEAMLADAEDAIAADRFVVLRFDDPVVATTTRAKEVQAMEAVEPPLQSTRCNGTTISPGQAARSRGAGASSRVAPPPPVRAPYIRSEQRYRRRGVWLEWQRPTPWRRGLAAAAWLYLAAHVAAWMLL